MTQRIQVRRGTAAAATAANPILAAGEFGYETDTGKVKIGDGVTAWNSLAGVGPNKGVKVTTDYASLSTIPDATFTKIPWATESYDDDYFDLATATRLTIPAGRAGPHYFAANFTWAVNTTGRRIISLYKNNVEIVRDERAPVTGTTPMKIAFVDLAAVGDYYELAVYQTSGGNLAPAQAFVGEQFFFTATHNPRT